MDTRWPRPGALLLPPLLAALLLGGCGRKEEASGPVAGTTTESVTVPPQVGKADTADGSLSGGGSGGSPAGGPRSPVVTAGTETAAREAAAGGQGGTATTGTDAAASTAPAASAGAGATTGTPAGSTTSTGNTPPGTTSAPLASLPPASGGAEATAFAAVKANWESKCAACHNMDGPQKVGPNLAGVTKRHEEQWLANWLKAPDRMLQTDSTAKELLAKYKVPMPNQNLSDAEVRQFIAYFKAYDAAH